MKKFIVAIVLGFVCFYVKAQSFNYNKDTGEICMTHIIEDTNLSVEDAYIATEDFFNKLYNNSNVTRRNTSSSNKLFYNGSFGTIASFQMGYWEIRDNHNITISIKDNRLKIDINSATVDLNMTKGAGIGEGTRYWSDLYPINSNMKVSKTNITKSASENAYNTWKALAATVINDFENVIKNYKTDEDW